MNRSPADLLDSLLVARSVGDVGTALACYENDAIIVVQPGQVKSGSAAICEVLEFFAASAATFTVIRRNFLVTESVALHLSDWTLRGTDPSGTPIELDGRSADVARRQNDGTWLLAIDNPWGNDSGPTDLGNDPDSSSPDIHRRPAARRVRRRLRIRRGDPRTAIPGPSGSWWSACGTFVPAGARNIHDHQPYEHPPPTHRSSSHPKVPHHVCVALPTGECP
jgi:ketosteroid isomerase-like protein